MKAQTVGVKESTGRILCCTIFRPGVRKLLAKGHVLSEEDVRPEVFLSRGPSMNASERRGEQRFVDGVRVLERVMRFANGPPIR